MNHMSHPNFLTAALLLVPVALSAQDSARVGRSTRIATAPQIDGRLGEAVWREAQPLTDFVQRDPSEGAPSTERTEVRILTDGEALYIGAWLFDRDAAAIVPGERIRDVTLTNSDYFSIIFDTYQDRQNGFVFATTPAGVEYDGQVVKEGEGGGVFQQGQSRAQAGSAGGFNLNWDASWTVATHVDSLGWYAEFRIPFSTLRYGNAGEQTWGLNVARSIRRRNEESFWSPIPRQYDLYRVSRAGSGRPPGPEPADRHRHAVRPQLGAKLDSPVIRRGGVGLDSVSDRVRSRRQAGDHAQPHPRRHLQHGLRPGRGRRAAHQPVPGFRCSFPRSGPSSSRTRACSRPGRRRPWSCSSVGASASTRWATPSRSSAGDA